MSTKSGGEKSDGSFCKKDGICSFGDCFVNLLSIFIISGIAFLVALYVKDTLQLLVNTIIAQDKLNPLATKVVFTILLILLGIIAIYLVSRVLGTTHKIPDHILV